MKTEQEYGYDRTKPAGEPEFGGFFFNKFVNKREIEIKEVK